MKLKICLLQYLKIFSLNMFKNWLKYKLEKTLSLYKLCYLLSLQIITEHIFLSENITEHLCQQPYKKFIKGQINYIKTIFLLL